MGQKALRALALGSVGFAVVLAAAWKTEAQDGKAPYANMAPPEQYLMERNAEIAWARSSAPESISKDAQIMVLGRHAYETAVKGTNGFVCMVERSWAAGVDDPEFWNPRVRGPICFNAPAVRSYLPLLIRKTELALAGRSKPQIAEEIETALDKKELPTLEPGVMGYMMSKHQYVTDRAGHWHPHLMIFVPLMEPAAWGAGLPGTPLVGSKEPEDRLTLFVVPVGTWSDGTASPLDEH